MEGRSGLSGLVSHPPLYVRLALFEAGRNVKQVQEWLGHADPGFTLRTYVHLMDAGVGDAEFFDEAVQPPEALQNAVVADGSLGGSRPVTPLE
jgi:hypothetical protein